MNRNYTLDDIEALRAKSGISYEEAVALLDKYDGDITRALIELEKRGVIDAKRRGKGGDSFAAWFGRIWALGLRTRVQITKNDQVLVNLSVTYLLLFCFFAPHMAFVSLILALVLGMRISMVKNSNLYGSADIQSMVTSAAENLKNTVKGFGKDASAEEAEKADVKVSHGKDEDDDDDDNDDFSSITIN